MNKQNYTLILSAVLLILAAAFTRLFPHYPNFTAIGAMAVFGGSVIKDKKNAFLFPIAALLLSDICLQLFTTTKGFYGIGQFFVYLAFILITALSTFMHRKSAANIALAAVWSGAVFFVISNLGVWITSNFYPKNLTGFTECFVAAVPFYKNEFFGNFVLNSIMGNLFYSFVLFGIYYLIERKTTFQKAMAG